MPSGTASSRECVPVRRRHVEWAIAAIVTLAFYWEISSLRETQERQLRIRDDINAKMGSVVEHLDQGVTHLSTIETNTNRIGL